MDTSEAPKPVRLVVTGSTTEDPGGRYFLARVINGHVATGARLKWLPRGEEVTVSCVRTLPGACADTVAIALIGEMVPGAGDFIVDAAQPADVADQFEVTVDWMGMSPLLAGRRYGLELAGQRVSADITAIKCLVAENGVTRIAARHISRGDVGVCNLKVDRALVFDTFERNPALGAFTILDDVGGDQMLGRGQIHFALRRAHNIRWQHVDVDKRARAALKGQRPCIVWLTGLSGAGKSTIANLVEKNLFAAGLHTYLLDGDNLRHGLNKDLGFTDADRVENIRRVAELAKLMVDCGLIVITAFISPFRSERRMARALVEPGEFLEVFVDTPLSVAEQRDVKGLYRKARRGELKNFTGIDSPYEVPEHPEIRIDTQMMSAEEAATVVVDIVRKRHGVQA